MFNIALPFWLCPRMLRLTVCCCCAVTYTVQGVHGSECPSYQRQRQQQWRQLRAAAAAGVAVPAPWPGVCAEWSACGVRSHCAAREALAGGAAAVGWPGVWRALCFHDVFVQKPWSRRGVSIRHHGRDHTSAGFFTHDRRYSGKDGATFAGALGSDSTMSCFESTFCVMASGPRAQPSSLC